MTQTQVHMLQTVDQLVKEQDYFLPDAVAQKLISNGTAVSLEEKPPERKPAMHQEGTVMDPEPDQDPDQGEEEQEQEEETEKPAPAPAKHTPAKPTPPAKKKHTAPHRSR